MLQLAFYNFFYIYSCIFCNSEPKPWWYSLAKTQRGTAGVTIQSSIHIQGWQSAVTTLISPSLAVSLTHVCIFTYWFGQGAVTKSCSCISVDKLRYVFRALWCHRLDRERSQWSARRRHALSAWHFYSLSEVTVTNEHVCFRERRFLFIIPLRSRKVRWCRLWQLEKITEKKEIRELCIVINLCIASFPAKLDSVVITSSLEHDELETGRRTSQVRRCGNLTLNFAINRQLDEFGSAGPSFVLHANLFTIVQTGRELNQHLYIWPSGV